MNAEPDTATLVAEAKTAAAIMDRVFGPERKTERELILRLVDRVVELDARNLSLTECLAQASFTVSLLRAWQVSPEQIDCLRRDLSRATRTLHLDTEGRERG